MEDKLNNCWYCYKHKIFFVQLKGINHVCCRSDCVCIVMDTSYRNDHPYVANTLVCEACKAEDDDKDGWYKRSDDCTTGGVPA